MSFGPQLGPARKAALAFLLLVLAPLAVRAQMISTVAGGGPNNLPASSANLNKPFSVARDSMGNLYIADTIGNRVYKVSAAGQLTVLAGTGTSGFSGDGGPAASAGLNLPAGVFTDNSGNVFIGDASNCLIRRVDAATGKITTVAGTTSGAGSPPKCGYTGDGGPATSATLFQPSGVFVDGSGNIFFADASNNVIREVVAATGKIQTVAGNGTGGFGGDGGPATSAQLFVPFGVFLDGFGNIFIADTSNCLIRRVDAATGKISSVAGTTSGAGTSSNCGFNGDGGLATNTQLSLPTGVFLDGSGNLFIADAGNQVVRMVAASTGNIHIVAGNGTKGFSGDGGSATSAELSGPAGIFLDAGADIFIADAGNGRIREVVASTGKIQTIAGNGTTGYSGDGGPATNASLLGPTGAFLDGTGNLFIVDGGNFRIREVAASTGNIQTVAGNGSPGPGSDGIPATSANISPSTLFVDSLGNMFLTDGNRIREVAASNGTIQTLAGNGGPCLPSTSPCGDGGPATSAQMTGPLGVFLDGAGNIFIADTFDNRIREVVAATGNIQTIAGNGTAGFSGDGGSAAAAELNVPQGVYVDGSGNIFIADTGNNRIRKVAGGKITTVAGNGTAGSMGDGGPATSAELFAPDGVFVDGSGNLWIADSGNNLVREVTNGTIHIAAGTGTPGFSGDGGPATSAELFLPVNVFVGASQSIFITDLGNNRTRRVAPAPMVKLSTTSLSFGNQMVGTMSAAQMVTVTNSGNAPLIITKVAASANFTEADNCVSSSPIAPSGTCTINVTFAPMTTGSLMGTVKITDNAANTPQSVSLSGTGVPPGPAVMLSTTVLNFGSQNVGTTSSAQMVTVTNTGTQALTVTSVAASANFGETDNCVSSSPIAVNGKCTVNVTFSPMTAGNLMGTLTLMDNAADSPQMVSLNGTGLATAVVMLSTLNVNFAPQGLGTMSGSLSVTLTNSGTGTLTITGISFSGMNSADFSETDDCSASVLAGAMCTIHVAFKPLGGGPRSAALLISDNAANNPQQVSLTGLGIGNIQTFAGNGKLGFGGDGGPATSAAIFLPQGACVDRFGNVFIADKDNNRVREVLASNGNIQTVAGNGTRGYNGDGIAATSAELNNPNSVAVDGSGNIYIADGFNNRIRRVDAGTGLISTVAGTGTAGSAGDGGPATAAQLSDPFGVFADASGNIFIADTSNQRIREVVAASGKIQTVAGNGTAGFSGDGGPATAAQLKDPYTVFVDHSGNLFIADILNHRIREVVAATGKIQTVAGNGTAGFSGDGGLAVNAELNQPEAVFLDGSGNLIIADTNNHRVREVVVSTGFIYTIAGSGTGGFSGDGGLATLAQLQFPGGVALDSFGNLYITDSDNSRIRRIAGAAAGPPSAVLLSSSSLSFGNQAIGSKSASQTVTITNTGAGALTIVSVMASANFTETDNCVSSSPIAGGGNCTINVTFAPTAAGSLMGTLTITDNAPGSPHSVSLSGTGAPAPPGLAVIPH